MRKVSIRIYVPLDIDTFIDTERRALGKNISEFVVDILKKEKKRIYINNNKKAEKGVLY